MKIYHLRCKTVLWSRHFVEQLRLRMSKVPETAPASGRWGRFQAKRSAQSGSDSSFRTRICHFDPCKSWSLYNNYFWIIIVLIIWTEFMLITRIRLFFFGFLKDSAGAILKSTVSMFCNIPYFCKRFVHSWASLLLKVTFVKCTLIFTSRSNLL